MTDNQQDDLAARMRAHRQAMARKQASSRAWMTGRNIAACFALLFAVSAGATFKGVRNHFDAHAYDPRTEPFVHLDFNLRRSLDVAGNSRGEYDRIYRGAVSALCYADDPRVPHGAAFVTSLGDRSLAGWTNILHRGDVWCPEDALRAFKAQPIGASYEAARMIPIRGWVSRSRGVRYPQHIEAGQYIEVVGCTDGNAQVSIHRGGREDYVEFNVIIDRGNLICPHARRNA